MMVKLGDEVRILKHRNRYDAFPEDGYEATITKIGRKYATATYIRQRTTWPPGPVEETFEFDLETGRERGGATNYGKYIRTPEQLERDKRKSAAEAVLRERGISLDFIRHKFTLEQIEALAEVAAGFDA